MTDKEKAARESLEEYFQNTEWDGIVNNLFISAFLTGAEWAENKRDEEWLDKMESLLSIAISNLGEGRLEVRAVGKFVNEMRQWAKGEE